MRYYILSIKCGRHADGCYLWYRPESQGYTARLSEAGLYSPAFAEDCIQHSGGECIPVERGFAWENAEPDGRVYVSSATLKRFKQPTTPTSHHEPGASVGEEQ